MSINLVPNCKVSGSAVQCIWDSSAIDNTIMQFQKCLKMHFHLIIHAFSSCWFSLGHKCVVLQWRAGTVHMNVYAFMCAVLSLTNLFWLFQSGSSRHAGECVQRLGDHRHLPPQQQTAGGGGSLHQANGQCV